jgi:hypothetical protein
MSDKMESIQSVLSPAYKMIADHCYPSGGSVARCVVCGKSRSCTTSEIAEWYQKGYPIHCGKMIEVDDPWKGKK